MRDLWGFIMVVPRLVPVGRVRYPRHLDPFISLHHTSIVVYRLVYTWILELAPYIYALMMADEFSADVPACKSECMHGPEQGYGKCECARATHGGFGFLECQQHNLM